ncbi:Protein F57C2.5 [Aphelenchoides avenae]|nr:Protein F57C2.5 [Aphelenchus avenae]
MPREVAQVFSTDKPLKSKRSKLLNDLVMIDDNTMLVTDTSTNYGWDSFLKAFLEHASDGRVLQVDMKTGEASVVMDGLNYVNGIEKHSDGQSVIVVESGMARILRYYYAGTKKGTTEMFANNLPGFPDNIRSSTRGTFFAALAFARHPVQLSPLDSTAEHPTVRKVLGELLQFELVRNLMAAVSPPEYSMILELDQDGNILAVYRDTGGSVLHDISQVTDAGNGTLYLGSFANDYIAQVKLS